MVVKVRIRFLSLGLHILIMLAVAVLAVVILFFWLDHYTRHGDVAEVPDVCGLYYLDADIALSEGGMRSTVIDSMYIGWYGERHCSRPSSPCRK